MSSDENRAKPVVFLAFANEQEGWRYLRDLPEESRQLRSILQGAKDRNLCELEVRTNVTLSEIDEVFRRHVSRVAIFHFGGHADAERLLMESAGGTKAAHAEGLAGYLGGQGGVKLVFLNGCSTRPQVAKLLDKGIDVVLAAARPVDDAAARAFAVDFYRQLIAGRSFRDAFERARDLAKAAYGDDPQAIFRDLAAYRPEDISDTFGFPWDLQVRPGAERTERMSLADLAGDPLLGLPALPPGGYLPPKPYPEPLQPFTLREAHVFFGRGWAIRALYNLVTSPVSRPVILYSGPTGVGKSSVLDAGLTPRLAVSHRVIHLRRNADVGLLQTLLGGLSPGSWPPPGDLGLAWREAEAAAGKPLAVILDQAEEAFTRPVSIAPSVSQDDAAAAHRSRIDPRGEIAELVGAVRALYLDASQAPRGRLILAFRQEWLQEFERPHDEAGLGYERMLLGPLDQAGVIEAIEGPTRDPDLQRHYRLTVEPGLARNIAAYLEGDSGSAVAPTLQVLLAKLWYGGGGVGGKYTRALYDRLYDQGILLQDVLSNGLKALECWNADVVESGLALDVLAYHATDQATAETRSLADLAARYAHRADVLDDLLGRCKEQYLLIEASAGPDPASREPATRLAHDTLAPLVLASFRHSQAPGQRACRLLENRAPEWVNPNGDPRHGAPLDGNDLKTVELGLSGMRGLDESEERLLAASRLAEEDRVRQEEERQRELREAREREQEEARKARESAEEAKAQARIAREEARVAESRRLAVLSDAARPRRLDAAMLLALEALRVKDSLEVRGALQRVLIERPEVAQFLHTPEGPVTSVAFGPDGRIAAGLGRKGVVLFDAQGHRIRTVPLGDTAWSAESLAFGPDGQLAVGCNGSPAGVALFNAQGERMWDVRMQGRRITQGEEGTVVSLAFGTDGRIAAGLDQRFGKSADVTLFDARGERIWTTLLEDGRARVSSVAFGRDGEIIMGYCHRYSTVPVTGVMILDAQGNRPRTVPLRVNKGRVKSMTVAPDGRIAAAYDIEDRAGGVVLFNAQGQQPHTEGLEVKEGKVVSVAFGPEGRLAVGYDIKDRVGGGVVLFDAEGYREPGTPMEVKEGSVKSVAFGPDGRIAAGHAGRGGPSGVVLFDPQADRIQAASAEVREGSVTSVAVKSDGAIAAGFGDRYDNDGSGVVLFNARGRRLRSKPLEVNEGVVISLAFGPEGQLAAGFGGHWDNAGGVVLFDGQGTRLRPEPLEVTEGQVTSVVFGPTGILAAGYGRGDSGGVVLFNARGERLHSTALELGEGEVKVMAFGPEGHIAAGFFNGAVFFHPRADGLRTAAEGLLRWDIMGTRSIAFGPGGETATGFGNDDPFIGSVEVFDAEGQPFWPAPLDVKQGPVTSVAFGPEGKLAVGIGHGFLEGVVVFEVDSAAWRRKAGQVANRNLTWEEWRRNFPETRYRRTIRSLPWPHDLPAAECQQAKAFEEEHP